MKSDNAVFYEAFAHEYVTHYREVDAAQAVRQWCEFVTQFSTSAVCETERSLPPSLLDLGCGPGWHLRPWQKQGYEVVGLDVSPTMLRIAASIAEAGQGTDIPLYCADVRDPNSITRLAGRFDLIVSHFNFLNLFSSEELLPLFRAVSSLLRSGGRYMTDISFWSDKIEPCQDSMSEDEPQVRTSVDTKDMKIVRRWQFEQTELCETYWFHELRTIENAAELLGLAIKQTRHWPEGARGSYNGRLLLFEKRDLDVTHDC